MTLNDETASEQNQMEDADDDDVDDIEWENGNGVVRCHNDEMTRD